MANVQPSTSTRPLQQPAWVQFLFPVARVLRLDSIVRLISQVPIRLLISEIFATDRQSMMPSIPDYKQRIAREGWTLFIPFLDQKQSHVDLPQPSLDEESEDDVEAGDMGCRNRRLAILQSLDESTWSKFLDCITQIMPPPKGWHSVVATAIREYKDHVAIDVARNDCFGMINNDSMDRQN